MAFFRCSRFITLGFTNSRRVRNSRIRLVRSNFFLKRFSARSMLSPSLTGIESMSSNLDGKSSSFKSKGKIKMLLRHDFPGNYQFLNFTRPLTNGAKLAVAVVFLSRKIFCVAVTSQDLNPLSGNMNAHL